MIKKAIIFLAIVINFAMFTVCSDNDSKAEITAVTPSTGQIYLYGESHGVEKNNGQAIGNMA